MKKVLFTSALLLLMVGFLASCSSTKTASSQAKTSSGNCPAYGG